MKFLVDAHLPPTLCALLEAAGHQALHTSQLPQHNETTDQTINELSVKDHLVVITKDVDFYHSHLLHGKPWKLLLIRTGNIRVRELKRLFQEHLPVILLALDRNSLVELDRQSVQIIV